MSNTIRAKVLILPKKGLRDPQGETILSALNSIGLGEEVEEVSRGALIEIKFSDKTSLEQAKQRLELMCEKILVNKLIESYTVEWEELG